MMDKNGAFDESCYRNKQATGDGKTYDGKDEKKYNKLTDKLVKVVDKELSKKRNK